MKVRRPVAPKPCGYWIYPGERRPVVVQAETLAEAERKVRESPDYDGFGHRVFTVEDYARMCAEGSTP